MLVLSRKQNQDIFIGDDVKITVLRVKGNTVQLGIEAPRDVHIKRGELTKESPDRQIAEVTVVYSDPESTMDVAANRKSVDPGPLQFEKAADETCTVRFRQFTPEALKHNRLKQIVNDIAISKSQNSSGLQR